MGTSATVFTTTFLLMTSVTGVEGTAALAPTAGQGIHIQNGKLWIGDLSPVEVSLMQTRFNYLFIYVPEYGLITVSNREFPSAAEGGRFEAGRLELREDGLGGLKVTLDSATPILGREAVTAWVAVDRSYSLDVASPMVGYGDDLEAPQAWKRYVGSSR